MDNIVSAGFIVANEHAIWGCGATADAAWADFLHGMSNARVRVIAEPTEDDIDLGDWTREDDYKISPASAALIAQVESHGGKIAWRSYNGVCCTVAEYENTNSRF